MKTKFKLFKIIIFFFIIFPVEVSAEDMLDKALEQYTQKAVEEKEVKPLPISRKKALIIAEQLEVVSALYDLKGGSLVNCIEKSVLKTCDTDWVTCIEDAWVVKFEVGDQCPVTHDGRLNVTILVDGHTGQIRSQYPEVDYFLDRSFCRDKLDCIYVDIKDNNNQLLDQKCFNFVYAQSTFSFDKNIQQKSQNSSFDETAQTLQKLSESCACQESRCEEL